MIPVLCPEPQRWYVGSTPQAFLDTQLSDWMNEAPLNPRNAPGGKGPGSPCSRAELAGEGPRHQEQGPEGVRVVRLGKKTGLAASHTARETLVNHRGGPPSGLASLAVLSSNSSKSPFAQISDPRKNKTS